MAVARVKTWVNDEVLTASDLNAEFNNILNNGESLGWPATGSKDLNGQEFILDADGDSSITADSDDTIDIRLLAKDQFEFLGTSTNEGNFTAIDTDTGAAAGPIWAMYRNATGATSDVLGRLLFQGKDDAGNKTDFSQIEVEVTDASTGSEDSSYNIWNTIGGTLTEQWHIGAGIYPEGTTDPGANDISAAQVFVADDITHTGDADNLIVFGTDTQSYETGGTSRLDISDTGVRMGAANVRVTTILDEDAMGTDSDTALATQQSIKAYVDVQPHDFEFISTAAIGLATTIEVKSFVIGYDYKVVLEAFAPTDDGEILWMLFSDDNTTWESGVADYQWAAGQGGNFATDTDDAQIVITGAIAWGNDASNTSSLEIMLINPMGTSEQTTCFWQGTMMGTEATPAIRGLNGGARFIQGTENVEGTQFLWSGGSTFKAQGDITLYRRKRS